MTGVFRPHRLLSLFLAQCDSPAPWNLWPENPDTLHEAATGVQNSVNSRGSHPFPICFAQLLLKGLKYWSCIPVALTNKLSMFSRSYAYVAVEGERSSQNALLVNTSVSKAQNGRLKDAHWFIVPYVYIYGLPTWISWFVKVECPQQTHGGYVC